jgi:hypothetical protein
VLIFLCQVKLKQGLKTAMAISSDGNAYLQVNLFQCLFLLTFSSVTVVTPSYHCFAKFM